MSCLIKQQTKEPNQQLNRTGKINIRYLKQLRPFKLVYPTQLYTLTLAINIIPYM